MKERVEKESTLDKAIDKMIEIKNAITAKSIGKIPAQRGKK